MIRNKVIAASGEDGIQLIDDLQLSSREFLIERNLILDSAFAGIGMMCCQNSVEDLQGASLGERVLIFNNTFVGNDHGISGGDNVIAINNLFAGSAGIALKRVDGNSIVAHSLLFGNGTNTSETNIDLVTTILQDPLLDSSHRLTSGSPAIDAGTAFFEWNAEVLLDLGSGEFMGNAPAHLDIRRQDFPPAYALNGAIYLTRRQILLEQHTFYPTRTFAYVMPPERSLDIDASWDFHLANLINRI